MPTLLHAGSLTHTHTRTHTHTNTFIQRLFLHTQTLLQPSHKEGLTQKVLHREAFTNRFFPHRSFHTEKAVNRAALYTEAFTHTKKEPSSLYTEQFLHTEAFVFLHAHTSLCQKELCTRTKGLRPNGFTHSSFHTEKPIHGPAFTFRRVFTQTPVHKEALT